MTTEHKQFIVNELEVIIANSSADKVAKRTQVSSASISQIRNNNWELISDSLWAKVKTNLNINWNWQIAQTTNLLTVNKLLKDAQHGGMSICICYKQASGKTTAYEYYQRINKNVILIRCKNYWSKKSFARHQLLTCGLADEGTTEEMIEKFQEHLTKLHKPLVIYDQFDKLKESQKDLFMDYYNELDGDCGFVLSGVPHLKKQEQNGYKRNKMGYRERFSRYGSKFIPLDEFSYKDVTAICNANGVTEKEVIQNIFDDYLGDGRRIKRLVERYFLIQAETVAETVA